MIEKVFFQKEVKKKETSSKCVLWNNSNGCSLRFLSKNNNINTWPLINTVSVAFVFHSYGPHAIWGDVAVAGDDGLLCVHPWLHSYSYAFRKNTSFAMKAVPTCMRILRFFFFLLSIILWPAFLSQPCSACFSLSINLLNYGRCDGPSPFNVTQQQVSGSIALSLVFAFLRRRSDIESRINLYI